jgi:hypothetical protein
MLSQSVELRALELIENGMDILEAVKLALTNENKFINEVLEQRTDRSKYAKSKMCRKVYSELKN